MKLLLGLVVVSLVFFADSLRLPRPQLQQAVSISKKVQLGEVWSDCSKAGDELKIKDIKITPDPPETGKPVTVYVEFELDENVTSGAIAASVKFDGITVLSKKLDLCTEIQQLNQTCPLAANNDAKVTVTQDVPSSPIHGTAKASVVVTDQSGKELVCIDLDLKV